MTYQEVLALMNGTAGTPYTYEVAGTGGGQDYLPGSATGSMWMLDPNDPRRGSVQRDAQGNVVAYSPIETGGFNEYSFNPDGTPLNQRVVSPAGATWLDSALGAAGTLGGAALLGNAGALLGGSAAPAAAAPAAAAAGSSMSPAIGAAAAGAGAAETLPAIAGAAGAAGAATAPSWASLLGQGASGLMSNGGLLATGLGALAGIAGNGDLTSSQSSTQSGTTSQNNSSGLASWMMPYAQDLVARGHATANQAPTNDALQTGTGLLGGLATQGDALVNAARGQQQNVIGGGMLGANPYINSVARDMAGIMGEGYATGTRAGMMGAASQSGNWDSAGAQQALNMRDTNFARALGEQTRGLLNNNYQFERGAQDNASRASLGFGQFASNNAQNLYNAGAQDWQRPWTQLGNMQSLLSPTFGQQSTGTGAANSTGTQTQNIQAPNNWMAGLGGAAMGAGLYRSIFGS